MFDHTGGYAGVVVVFVAVLTVSLVAALGVSVGAIGTPAEGQGNESRYVKYCRHSERLNASGRNAPIDALPTVA